MKLASRPSVGVAEEVVLTGMSIEEGAIVPWFTAKLGGEEGGGVVDSGDGGEGNRGGGVGNRGRSFT